MMSLKLPFLYFRGNHEDYILNPNHMKETGRKGRVPGTPLYELLQESYLWTREQLGEKRLTWIENQLIHSHLETFGSQRIFFCHGTYHRNDEHFTDETLLQAFETTKANLIIGGHTHRQVDLTTTLGRYINVGSLGMPFDRLNHSSYALLDPSSGEIEVFRLPYQLETTLSKLSSSPFPKFNKYAAAHLKHARVVRLDEHS